MEQVWKEKDLWSLRRSWGLLSGPTSLIDCVKCWKCRLKLDLKDINSTRVYKELATNDTQAKHTSETCFVTSRSFFFLISFCLTKYLQEEERGSGNEHIDRSKGRDPRTRMEEFQCFVKSIVRDVVKRNWSSRFNEYFTCDVKGFYFVCVLER